MVTERSPASPIVCVVVPQKGVPSETFIKAHLDRLPGTVYPLFGIYPYLSTASGLELAGFAPVQRLQRHLGKRLNRDFDTERVVDHLVQKKVSVVLAEYGPTGARMTDACRRAGIPLVVHFHGYDASQVDVLEEFGAAYRAMFDYAARVICVSNQMRRQLLSIGAPNEKLVLSPYGVDMKNFADSAPAEAKPIFVGVGRFVEKKAPYLTILAFAQVVREVPDAKLVLIGNGPLFGPCRKIVDGLHLEDSVDLMGVRPHETVAATMRAARAFVQHSVVASNGDSEGTPVAILEAGASGLPVVATRHAGIIDSVVEGKTGFLVDEGDIDGMAAHMIDLAKSPALAGEMGAAARKHIAENYSMDDSISRLWSILRDAMKAQV